ncbi:gap junction delta-3 protein isoform X1 [Gallus gallus]|uniref:gap junction delta-3 protein isoform X1 n=1 Tax=Gallus gallus TaxID=9031 RepID=UPI001AE53F24|nr:gap junction delta-3 protein isoform X1 [Gallus gallus]
MRAVPEDPRPARYRGAIGAAEVLRRNAARNAPSHFPPPGSGQRLRRVPADGSAICGSRGAGGGTARRAGPLRSPRRHPDAHRALPAQSIAVQRGDPPGPAPFPAPSGAVGAAFRPTRDALRPPRRRPSAAASKRAPGGSGAVIPIRGRAADGVGTELPPQRRASGASEALPDAVQERSPTGGPPLAMLPFRVPVVATAGSDVFEDEREELARNTRQPGCKPPRCGAAFPARITASFSSTFRPLGAVPHLRGAPNGQSGAPDGAAVPRGPRRRSYRGGRRSAVPSAAALRVPPPAVSAPRPRLRVRPTEKTAFIRFCFAVGLASAPLSLAELRRLLRNSRTAPEGSPPPRAALDV